MQNKSNCNVGLGIEHHTLIFHADQVQERGMYELEEGTWILFVFVVQNKVSQNSRRPTIYMSHFVKTRLTRLCC